MFQVLVMVAQIGLRQLAKEAAKGFLDRAALCGKFMELLQPLLAEFAPCSCRQRTPHHFRE
jgi:hypothetical protein